jgi:hypothetical protein
MRTPADPFVGTWTLSPEASVFDPRHQPRSATMRFERTPEGDYLMTAEGVNGKGERVAERPQRFVPDGHAHPIAELPDLSVICTTPDGRTLQTEARRGDGSLVGQGTYAVSADGQTLTATTSGVDSQQREFRQVTAWIRTSRVIAMACVALLA